MASYANTITGGANHTGVTRFNGFSVREDSSAAAVIEFRIAVVGGDIVWHLALAADESASIIFPSYITTEGGVYVKEVSGSIEGVLFQST